MGGGDTLEEEDEALFDLSFALGVDRSDLFAATNPVSELQKNEKNKLHLSVFAEEALAFEGADAPETGTTFDDWFAFFPEWS
mmetsp:Transcript_28436/g.64478  ORF Transcript_28436/g.64478 Transcript_28436/m.64478 type:complete len:82 (-) Transcript_28436:744-989(-)